MCFTTGDVLLIIGAFLAGGFLWGFFGAAWREFQAWRNRP